MMHPRGCYCDDCNPGTRARPTRLTLTEPSPLRRGRRRLSKRQQNARAYVRRKLRAA
jgi:hypothetical protein